MARLPREIVAASLPRVPSLHFQRSLDGRGHLRATRYADAEGLVEPINATRQRSSLTRTKYLPVG